MSDKPGRLDGKVAIVTGGNSGIGAATVELFVAEGARVVIAARGEAAGQALADRLGENALFVRTDVAAEADVQALFDATLAQWGRVDALFNNAGIGQPYLPPQEFTIEDFDRIMRTNLASCFLGLKYAAPIMKEQGGGSIISNGSTAGVTTDGSGPVYSASKAALIQVTKVWATQLAEFGVRVNCISPGAVVTPIFWGDTTRNRPRRTRSAPSGSPSTSTSCCRSTGRGRRWTSPTARSTWPAMRAATPRGTT